MNNVQLQILSLGLLLLLVFLLGFRLHRPGKPYPVLLFNLHKLTALSASIILIVIVYHAHQAAPLGNLAITVTMITAILFVASILTGGLITAIKSPPALIATLHRLLPYLTLLSTALTLHFSLV